MHSAQKTKKLQFVSKSYNNPWNHHKPITISEQEMSITEDAFNLLLSVAGSARVHPPPMPPAKKKVVTTTSKKTTGKKQLKKNKVPVGSTGSFFLEEAGAGGSQTVYRRASVYFSIVKSSRKFPGYFNPVEKRVIVNW